ncbi:hypothetical protein ASPCADRAFT_7556 [Aspergillus carbonarius ITEM 5010]|uniref:Uncharacterized protein n=1 Tax=Aspergillus carbonarius (strain ITEM 5010) TaxID=602072 RepID=A0A1R3RFS5_ASPC5|nr:hypothetical protein ASPCADRAFT_7556 [Aspergillus carbonarius ITEM 5010]
MHARALVLDLDLDLAIDVWLPLPASFALAFLSPPDGSSYVGDLSVSVNVF